MIGPKNAATPAVPRLCAVNSRMRMTTVAGKMNGASSVSTCLRPSSAESTEMAGVIIASPENSAEPATPSRKTAVVRLPNAVCASAFSDRMPPSPLLSACIRNSTYFAVTTISSAQMISDTMPTTSPDAEAGALELAERRLAARRAGWCRCRRTRRRPSRAREPRNCRRPAPVPPRPGPWPQARRRRAMNPAT